MLFFVTKSHSKDLWWIPMKSKLRHSSLYLLNTCCFVKYFGSLWNTFTLWEILTLCQDNVLSFCSRLSSPQCPTSESRKMGNTFLKSIWPSKKYLIFWPYLPLSATAGVKFHLWIALILIQAVAWDCLLSQSSYLLTLFCNIMITILI